MGGFCFFTRIVIATSLVASTTSGSAYAADVNAAVLTKLFVDACVPNIGKPEQVRLWAQKWSLEKITNPAELDLYVGAGEKGAAWGVPSGSGRFALAIRGETQACAAWAVSADPNEVEANFRRIVEGVKRPGISIDLIKDVAVPSKSGGQAKALVYGVSGVLSAVEIVMTMLTTENPGGPFQASLQIAVGRAEQSNTTSSSASQPSKPVQESVKSNDASCKKLRSDKSGNSQGVHAPLTVSNHSSSILSLWWVDFDGHRRHYNDVSLGRAQFENTFVTHLWEIDGPGKECIAIVRVGPYGVNLDVSD